MCISDAFIPVCVHLSTHLPACAFTWNCVPVCGAREYFCVSACTSTFIYVKCLRVPVSKCVHSTCVQWCRHTHLPAGASGHLHTEIYVHVFLLYALSKTITKKTSKSNWQNQLHAGAPSTHVFHVGSEQLQKPYMGVNSSTRGLAWF